ncbi:hypothetical protein ACFE04_026764 [Oxalis oulophora]
MADNNNEEREENNTSRGNDWEVVSLTASTYAAAPGPRLVEPDNSDIVEKNQSELSDDLINSRHFESFKAPDQEILPIDDKDSDAKMVQKEVGKSSGEKKLDDLIPDEIFGTQFEKNKDIVESIHETGFEHDSNMEGSNFSDKEQDVYGFPPMMDAFKDESAFADSTAYGENKNTTVAESDASELGFDSAKDISESSMPAKDDKSKGSDNIPCEPWWKSKASSLYTHAKEANTFWSIFIAAAVMGIVILGRKKWQSEKWQAVEIKRQLSTNNTEKTAGMVFPIYRFKDVILGGHPRGSFMRSGANEM